MRRIIKGIVNRTWKPYVEWYLRRPRNFRYKSLQLEILPGVFHPGFFFSTKLLLEFLSKENFSGKRVIEIGSGSGLISIFLAKQGARVTAAEIAPLAVKCTCENAKRNAAAVTVIESDLFKTVPEQQFDFIIVNPPYFKKNPSSPAEQAWYAGENLEYFQSFFRQSRDFVHSSSKVIMVLSDECDIAEISAIAGRHNWIWEETLRKRTAWETGFIFNICPSGLK